jgi:hypothetical protein
MVIRSNVFQSGITSLLGNQGSAIEPGGQGGGGLLFCPKNNLLEDSACVIYAATSCGFGFSIGGNPLKSDSQPKIKF